MIGFRLRTFLTLCSLVVVSSIFGRWRQELVDHSMNYRSVVAFGTARKIVDPAQKSKSLGVISEHLIAGRWMEVRAPTMKELNATTVLEFSIEEASSKVRSGPPLDDETDYELPVWAGVLPLEAAPSLPYRTIVWSTGSSSQTTSVGTTLGSMARAGRGRIARERGPRWLRNDFVGSQGEEKNDHIESDFRLRRSVRDRHGSRIPSWVLPRRSIQSLQHPAPPQDGQHDFDFEIGTWKTHLKRLLHPLTGSTT